MTQEILLQYLAGVLRIELDVYVQKKTIEELTRYCNSLGVRNKLNVPRKGKSKVCCSDCIAVTGFFCGLIGGVLGIVYGIIDFCSDGGGFFNFIGLIIAALLYAAISAIAGSFTIGPIVFLIKRARENKALEEQLQADISEYNDAVRKQNSRIRLENKKIDAIKKEISALYACQTQSLRHLSEIYSYDIIDPDYQNIYAVSSFYGYVRKGRTCSLHFDPVTGDQGAYNLYENERRLDLIITNTDEILNRLDQVIQNQYDLAIGLKKASAQIKSLCGSVNQQLRSISGSVESIERCQNIIAYNSECNRRALDFLTWIHTVY